MKKKRGRPKLTKAEKFAKKFKRQLKYSTPSTLLSYLDFNSVDWDEEDTIRNGLVMAEIEDRLEKYENSQVRTPYGDLGNDTFWK